MVCVSVSMAMLNIEDYFTRADTVSVVLQFVFALILIIYVAYVFFFTIFRARLLKDRKIADLLEKRKILEQEV